jgi:hypothetical protein
VLFASFAAGCYHNPLVEERALLFIDMRASTAIAERLGELRYLSLLNRFVGDVSFAVAEASGGIHKYVGDEVIATWRLAAGANPPACVNAAFAALNRIAAQGPTYQRERKRTSVAAAKTATGLACDYLDACVPLALHHFLESFEVVIRRLRRHGQAQRLGFFVKPAETGLRLHEERILRGRRISELDWLGNLPGLNLGPKIFGDAAGILIGFFYVPLG